MSEKYSFTIPCYGSEQTIALVIEDINKVMSTHPEIDYEIIAVNDCSPDNVFEVLKDLANKDKRIKVVNFSKNFGKHSALLAAYRFAEGDIIIALDDDGQCPLDKLWELVEPLYNNYDISMAKYPQKKQSAFKNFGSKINSFMETALLAKPKGIEASNFCAMKRFITDEMINYTNAFPNLSGLMYRTSNKIANVEMEEKDRISGKGNFNFYKSLSLWLNGFTAFSVKPLRIATVAGFICAFIGFIFGFIVIIRKIIDPAILMGYSSIIAVLLLIGGIIMIMMGLIGEYLGRIYICLNRSPQYVIKECINIKS